MSDDLNDDTEKTQDTETPTKPMDTEPQPAAA